MMQSPIQAPIQAWLDPAVVQRLAGSLLHFLWQGAALVLLTAALLRLLSRRRPETRYAVSVITLLLMLLCPVLTFFFYTETGAITVRVLHFAAETFDNSGRNVLASAETAAWSQWIVIAWLFGVSVCAVRLAGSWRLFRRLRASAIPSIPPAMADAFERIRTQLSIRCRVKLMLSEHVDTPAVLGWLRPFILVPANAIADLGRKQLLAVLAHEMAHIRRHDFVVNVLQSAVESILFYHPGVWWLSARIRLERENCCDDLAVQVCGDRLLYAQALIELERKRSNVPAFALAAGGNNLTLRVRRILGRETASSDWPSSAIALVVVIVWMIAGIWQSSSAAARSTPSAPRLASFAPAMPAAPQSVVRALESVAAIVTAQPVQPAPQLSVDPTKGTLLGTVTRRGTGAPLANVQITIETPADSQMALATKPNGPQAIEDLFAALTPLGISRTNMPQAAPLPMDRVLGNIGNNAPTSGVGALDPDLLAALRRLRASTARFKTLSDASGRFTFTGLPPGTYTVQAENESYFGVRPDGTNAAVESQTVTIAEGQSANTKFTLSPGGTLVGRIRDANDQPVARAFVQANSVVYVDGIPRLDGASIGVTDDRGEYRMFWLPPGDYYVYASVQPFGGANAARRMPPAASVTTTETPVRTFLPGTIDVSRAIPVTVRAGTTVNAGDFVLQSAAARTVSGVIGSTVPPTANSKTVQAVLQLAPRNTGLAEAIRQVGMTMLDPGKGVFTINGVLPGSYELYVRVPYALGGNAWGRASFDVADKDVAGVVVEITPNVAVPGAIRLNGLASFGTGLQLELIADGVFAKLVDLNIRMGGQKTFRPNPDGTFDLTNTPPAHYHLDVKGLLATQYVNDIRQGANSVFDAGFDVGKETPNAVQIILSEGAASATGTVRDSAGKPMPNATVVLVPTFVKRQNWTLYRKVTTDDSGRFSIRSITPGEYKLFAWDSVPNGAWFDPKFLEKHETRGTSVRLSESGSANSDLTVPASSR